MIGSKKSDQKIREVLADARERIEDYADFSETGYSQTAEGKYCNPCDKRAVKFDPYDAICLASKTSPWSTDVVLQGQAITAVNRQLKASLLFNHKSHDQIIDAFNKAIASLNAKIEYETWKSEPDDGYPYAAFC